MSEPTRVGAGVKSALAAVLERMRLATVDDAAAARQEALLREASEVEARQRRRDRLESSGAQGSAEMRAAVICGRGLNPGVSLVTTKFWRTNALRKPWHVLVGGTGCGKSVSALWAIGNGPESSTWCNVEDAIRTFAGYFGAAADRQEVMRRCKLLVLDDAGTEADKDAFRVQALLVELLKARESLDTIVTSNIDCETWKRRYQDERLHSRLAKQAVFVVDNGPDLRGVR